MHCSCRSFPVRLLALSKGAALVEFALVLPLLFLLVVGLIDLGLAAFGSLQVQAAAEAGAQYAARNPWSVGGIETEIASATSNSAISANPAPVQVCGCSDSGAFVQVACSATCTSGNAPGIYGVVNAQLQYTPLLPYPGIANPLLISGRAYRRIK